MEDVSDQFIEIEDLDTPNVSGMRKGKKDSSLY